MPTETASLREMDLHSALHPYTQLAAHQRQGARIIVGGDGVRVRDDEGREYIDAMAGLWCVNVGWGRPEVVEAIRAQAERLAYFHSFSSMANEPAIELGERVLRLAPKSMERIFFGCTGSDANDTNVKLVWTYNNLRGRPEKKKIVSRRRAYHGVTLAAASMSGLSTMHEPFDLPLPRFLHTENPHYYWRSDPDMSEREYSRHLAGELRALIENEGPETVAAFIGEPLMGAGGVIPPPEGYWEEVGAVLREHDVLLIADEVICGFGRLGRWFGCDLYGLEPDIMTIAKGLTSAYVPMSGSMVSKEIWQALVEAQGDGYFAHGFTYSGHPLAAAAGLANLDILEREDLPGNAARVGEHFHERLHEALDRHPNVGEVRGVGLIAAVELVKDSAAKKPFELAERVAPRLAALSMEEGLIARALPQSNAVSFSPPLVLTVAEAEEIVERFTRALERLTPEL